MNYKGKIIQYIGLMAIFAVIWYWLEKKFLHNQEHYDIFSLIVGTHGGYGYYMLLASVFMIVFFLILAKTTNPYSITEVSRLGRKNAFKRCFCEVVKTSLSYTFIYVSVQVIYVLIYVDWEQLIAAKFFIVMMMYYIAVFSILCFGGSCYLVLYIVFRNTILSMLLTVTISMILAYFGDGEILYGGLTVVDKMIEGANINLLIWLINQIINFCIIGVMYIIGESIYYKKDIV